jgi:integrase
MLRKEFISGGNPAKTGTFRCEPTGVRAACAAATRRDRRRIWSGVSASRGRPAGHQSMATVFHPDPQRLARLGYAAPITHVPVLFDSASRYCRAHNRYLRERAMLEWHPGAGSDVPRPTTLKNIADNLSNFIQWCETRGASWQEVKYAEVLAYQREQISGRWSCRGKKLEASTANHRADEATSFLRWAAERGLRGPFDAQMFFRTVRTKFGAAQVMVRAGRAKENLTTKTEKQFKLPKATAVKAWLDAVKRQRGYAKYLVCRMILEVGARRKEVEALEVHQWPSAAAIEEAYLLAQESVPMDLVETKGGRPRTVWVPLEYAGRVREWIDEKRSTYAYRYQVEHKKPTYRLFLSDAPGAHGNPVSVQTIYRCFSQVNPRPKLWSPHKGRHAFACFFVLHALSVEAQADGGLSAKGASWVMNRGDFWLRLLRKQFGHMSEETTEVYLRWLRSACGLTELASGWHRFLEGSDD